MSRAFKLVYGSALVGVGFALGAWMLAPEERVRTFGEAVENWLMPASAYAETETKTFSPVRGLRALRAARRFTSKTPKFRSSIRWSSTSVSTIASKVFWTISFVLSCVRPISSEMVLTISFLVTRGFPYEKFEVAQGPATPSRATALMFQV